MANTPTGRIKRAVSPHVSEPPEGTWSNCLVVDGVAYVAGMVSRGSDGKVVAGDEYDQAKMIFLKIKNLVEAAGGVLADVVKVTIFVTDISQREKVWRAPRVLRWQFSCQHVGAGRCSCRTVAEGGDRSGRTHWRRHPVTHPRSLASGARGSGVRISPLRPTNPGFF